MQVDTAAAMNDLRHAFGRAALDAKQLSRRPDNDTLLKLYALYKQGTVGDADNKQPGVFDVVGSAKHEAWTKLHGLTQDDAMRRYVALVEQLTA